MIEKHVNIVINITTFRYYLKIIANKNGKKANVKSQKIGKRVYKKTGKISDSSKILKRGFIQEGAAEEEAAAAVAAAAAAVEISPNQSFQHPHTLISKL